MSIDPNTPNQTLLHQFAHVVGLFGSRGWPSICVVLDDGTEREYPVTEQAASRIQYCRKLLNEHGRSPITP